MAGVRRREIRVVVVAALDRLARSLPHFAALGAELEALGCQLVSLREAIDTGTPMGRAMFAMSGVFAQLERDLVVERTRAGLEAARRRGKKLGRPRTDYGRRTIDRAKRLQAAGRSVREIAAVLGTSRSRAHRILHAH
jgi:DNA invertase Pin-like site-specific DNA recombinase